MGRYGPAVEVCVTGANGFLGSAVVRALVHGGYPVRALVRVGADVAALAELPGVRVEPLAEWSADRLRTAMEGCEGLCHVAGAAGRFYPDADHYERTNVALTVEVFEAARAVAVRRAVYTGSVAAVYGLANAYAESKRRGLAAAQRVGGAALPVVAVHPSGMLGGFDRTPTPMGRAIAQFVAGRANVVVGGGSGYIHVDDAGAGHVAALERGDPARDYVLDAEYWTIAALFEALARIIGRTPPRVLPVGLAHALARVVDPVWRLLGRVPPINTFTTSYLALPREKHTGGQAAREALGLPPYQTVEVALREAVQWARRNEPT